MNSIPYYSMFLRLSYGKNSKHDADLAFEKLSVPENFMVAIFRNQLNFHSMATLQFFYDLLIFCWLAAEIADSVLADRHCRAKASSCTVYSGILDFPLFPAQVM